MEDIYATGTSAAPANVDQKKKYDLELNEEAPFDQIEEEKRISDNSPGKVQSPLNRTNDPDSFRE